MSAPGHGSVMSGSEVGRLGRRRVGRLHADAQLVLDLRLDLVGQVGGVAQEVAGIVLAFPELVTLVGVPATEMADEALLDADVDKAALAAEAGAPDEVELRLL